MAAKIEDVPVLEGWVNLTEAAEKLGVTRQHAYKLAKNGGFSTLHQLGTKPAYVVNTTEIEKILAARTESSESSEA